jgi:glycerophosphoryl diester phosphodiesterase
MSLYSDRLSNLPAGCICIGHRGARAFAPENTLPAIEKAARLGCTMVEVDVHLSRDGAAVVHHDDRLQRCTDVQKRFPDAPDAFVSDFTLAQLRTLDAGSWYVRELALPPALRQPFLRLLTDAELATHVLPAERQQYAEGGIGIPTLDEMLVLARGLDLWVNIELKSIPRMYPAIAEKMLDAVVAARMERRVLVSSFDHQQLLEVRRRTPAIPTGVLTSDRIGRPCGYLELLDADAYHPGCYDGFDSIGFGSVAGAIDARGITEVRTSGRRVFVWTCNDPAQMAALARAGASGIITDYPNRFRAALDEPAT